MALSHRMVEAAHWARVERWLDPDYPEHLVAPTWFTPSAPSTGP